MLATKYARMWIDGADSFSRIFDLSTDTAQPEQEYYLQPVEPSSSCNAAATWPVSFSFGQDHLWDKFSVRGYFLR